VERLLI